MRSRIPRVSPAQDVLEKVGLRGLDDSRAGQIFSTADADNTNDLDLDEFCVAMRLLELEIANQYVAALRLFFGVREWLHRLHAFTTIRAARCTAWA
jgi:Cytoskeletal-regulatory complex EF hand